MTDGPFQLELVPDRGLVARWTLATGGAAVAFAWVLVDSGGHPLAWIAVTFGAVVTLYFLAQLIAPSRFHVRLDEDGLDATFLTSRTAIAWNDVHVARVTRVAGEPSLELELRALGEQGRGATRTVVLPVGTDLQALHHFLAARLGRGVPQPPRTFTAIDGEEEA